MSSIQLQLIGFYYGGSKHAEATQRAIEQRQGRAAAVVEEIAKTVAPAPPAGAVTPAPMNPETGNVPAAETATLTERKGP